MNKKVIGYVFMTFLLIFTSDGLAQMEILEDHSVQAGCAEEGRSINLASDEKCCKGLIPQLICSGDGACILSERICMRPDPTMPPTQEPNMIRGTVDGTMPPMQEPNMMRGIVDGTMPPMQELNMIRGTVDGTMPPMQEPNMMRGTSSGGLVPISSIDNATKEAGVKRTKISAEEAVNYSEIDSVEEIELKTEKTTKDSFYFVSGIKKGKLLFFFDVETPVQSKINVVTGETKIIKKPWYYFLISN